MNSPPASQLDRIKQLLHTGKAITPGEALLVFGCFRLAARIKELRNAGLLIDTTIKNDANGKRYASYKLSIDMHPCVNTSSRVCDCRRLGEGCHMEQVLDTLPPIGQDPVPLDPTDDQVGC